MSKESFLNKNNVATLWDVIADEDIFKNHSTDVKSSILQIFSDNIKGFYNSESRNSKISLMEMNKKYIVMILNFIKTNYPSPTINKIVIHNEQVQLNNTELVTIEERKKERQNDFESKLQIAEEEFRNAIKQPLPETPNFSDNVKEKPITEMERAIKEMLEQRNYEIEQINNQTHLKNANVMDNITKINTINNANHNTNHNANHNANRRLKHIQVDNVEYLNQKQSSNKKHIQWQDEINKDNKINDNIQLIVEDYNNNDNNDKDDTEEQNIFSKLKPITNDKNRIDILENQVKNINTKIDEINLRLNQMLNLLQNK
jgi:hypothetical protein